MIPTAAAFVRASLNKVGLQDLHCIGLTLLEYFVGVLGWEQAMVIHTHELHMGIHERVDRKLARGEASMSEPVLALQGSAVVYSS